MTTQIPVIEPGTLLTVDKTPSELEDFEIDWSQRGLGPDTIASSSWTTSAPADLQIASSPAPSFTSTNATAWLDNGTAGTSYIVTNTITTSGGRTLQESFVCNCIAYRLITN